MAATHSLDSTASVSPVLYLAFELSAGQWKLATTTARGQRARRCVRVAGGNLYRASTMDAALLQSQADSSP